MPVTLVTGPVRSGKSRHVANLAAQSGRAVTFVATALRDPDDPEWTQRLRRHLNERPAQWETIETATLSHTELLKIFMNAGADRCFIVDALGTWLAARLSRDLNAFARDYVGFEATLDREAAELADAMLRSEADVLVVAEEAGWDVVPIEASGRLFRDVLGRLKQRLALRAARVYLVVSGFAIDLLAGGVRIE